MVNRSIPLPRTALDLGLRTLVMGVINTTPDSFSDGGDYYDTGIAVEGAVAMLRAGADIIDVGGESTRPGSVFVEPQEEIRRAAPVIRGIHQAMPDAVISVDTRRRKVAEAAFAEGAQIVNDVSGFRDEPGLIDLAREAGVGVVIMHMLGTPRTMQQNIHYDDFPGDIYDFLEQRIRVLEDAGIDPEKIVIDPGIGFGKTFDQNLVLINRLDCFKPLGKPILVGSSRKAFIGKILDEPIAANRDVGTLATVAAAILRGADIVRVHDVAPAVQVCKVTDAILRERLSE